MLTIPGKDFVAIADIIRVDLATQPPSNGDIANDSEGVEQVPPDEVLTMTLRVVHEPHLISEFDMHPPQTMDEHAHYHFYSPLEISASKFLGMLDDARGAAGGSATAADSPDNNNSSHTGGPSAGVVVP
eukprot:gene481-750_t